MGGLIIMTIFVCVKYLCQLTYYDLRFLTGGILVWPPCVWRKNCPVHWRSMRKGTRNCSLSEICMVTLFQSKCKSQGRRWIMDNSSARFLRINWFYRVKRGSHTGHLASKDHHCPQLKSCGPICARVPLTPTSLSVPACGDLCNTNIQHMRVEFPLGGLPRV